jgi:branched-chain amino acid aminotransferase
MKCWKEIILTDAYIRPLLVCSPNMSLTKGKDAELLIAAWEWNSFLGNDPLRVTVSPLQDQIRKHLK